MTSVGQITKRAKSGYENMDEDNRSMLETTKTETAQLSLSTVLLIWQCLYLRHDITSIFTVGLCLPVTFSSPTVRHDKITDHIILPVRL